MFNRPEKNLRGQGKGDLADAVKALHKLNGSDIPLPGKEGVNISRFSAEQRKGLERKGYLVYSLTGQTIATLRDAGHPFWSTWHQGEAIEQVRSLLTEVAVHPKNLFLSDSNRKTFDEQLAMVEKLGKKMAGEVKGVTAILGTVPDYAELAFSHLSATGKRLFGKEYDYDYTRTTTPTGGSLMPVVGRFTADFGLYVSNWLRDARDDDIWAAPLVVPSAAVGR
jgi:hypothetical protein